MNQHFLDRMKIVAQFLTWASRSIFLVASVLIIVPLSPPSGKEIRGRLKLRNSARFESAFSCLPWAISRASELYSHKFFSNITGLIWKWRYPLSKFSEVVWSRPKSVHICRLFVILWVVFILVKPDRKQRQEILRFLNIHKPRAFLNSCS